MPDVVGTQLDVAKSDIERAGYGGEVEVVGGGLFGVIDESNWQVCEQLPAAGESVSDTPRLIVDRACEVPEQETDEPDPASPDPSATDITVDELLDKLNSAGMGGIEVGDRFHLTGELFMSELWMTGATGDYFVMLKAQGGAQDLPVFVDQSETVEWQDGTIVELVVEAVEATIDGETSAGWLRAKSATIVS